MTTLATKSKNSLNFVVGQTVLRAVTSGRTAYLCEQVVTRIENGKMYLDNSKVAIQYPERIWILT
jgi:hypothetical protein